MLFQKLDGIVKALEFMANKLFFYGMKQRKSDV